MTEREKAKTLHDVMMDKVMTERQIDVSLYLQLTGSFLSGLQVCECKVTILSGTAEHAIPHLQLFKNDWQVERKSWDVQRLNLKTENKQLIETLDATNRLFLKVRAGPASAHRMLNRNMKASVQSLARSDSIRQVKSERAADASEMQRIRASDAQLRQEIQLRQANSFGPVPFVLCDLKATRLNCVILRHF
jgi:hypothetical protein